MRSNLKIVTIVSTDLSGSTLYTITGHDKQNLSIKLCIFSYPSVLTKVLGAQKNRLMVC